MGHLKGIDSSIGLISLRYVVGISQQLDPLFALCMKTVGLRAFMASVPTCVETDSLAIIGQLFQHSNSEQVVVLNIQQQPIGILSLSRCWSIFSEISAAHMGALTLRDSLQSVQSNWLPQTPPLLGSLTLLPEHWNIEQFWPHLERIEQEQWALVNEDDVYLGLLDRLGLLQYLALHPYGLSQSRSPLHHQPAPAVSASSLSPLPLNPLLDLLERLPLPLMLQTPAGQVVTQNLMWRQQVGELRDPGQVQQEAASLLEIASDALAEHPHYSSTESVSWQNQTAESQVMDPGSDCWDNSNPSSFRSHSFCRLGNEPNTCICVCPMKNGQERVWQFVKVPMGSVPLQTMPSYAQSVAASAIAPDAASEHTPETTPFKLAMLSFSPDPNWQTFAQTDQLWLVLAQDITEHHQVARELAAKNADLMQLNRFKDEFLACISHELKTPLTAVLGLSSLLKDQALGPLNDRQSRYVQLIYQSGRHLILIVNDILDLTRIETGQLDLMLEAVSIETVCTRAYEQVRQLPPLEVDSGADHSSTAEIQCHIQIQPGLSSLIADELRLRQMLVNLLSNAFKFTEPGGEIGINVENWDGWIAFTVWDTGIGIPVDKQHLIFQKFQQLENPMTRRYEGTGLGLVLTQRLARLHGGDVTFTSVEGEGSRFTLLLPHHPPQANPMGRTQAVAPVVTAQNRLVLVVEATHPLLENLTHSLMKLGYRVAIARSGTEALAKIRRLQPCVVLLNPMLPLLSGWDLLVLLKADEETRHIPIIVTAMRVEKEQAYQNGADAFLSQPIQPEALQACLEQVVPASEASNQLLLSRLTVLHLYLNDGEAIVPGAFASEVNPLLQRHHCRVLEVDDLEQADLLARVWKPDVLVIEGEVAHPAEVMRQLATFPFLSALPLVTLSVDLTHAANQIPGLSVFPCLHPADSHESDSAQVPLVQVIQIAAGIQWTPHVLIASVSRLDPAEAPPAQSATAHSSSAGLGETQDTSPELLRSTQGVQALMHYIQMAGFRSSVGQTWEEIIHHLQHQSVDVLLLCVHSLTVYPQSLPIFEWLRQIDTAPLILVWCPESAANLDEAALQTFCDRWETMATQVLSPSLPVPELLVQINQVLVNRSAL